MKRLLSLILAIVMIAAMVPGMALAADATEVVFNFGNPTNRINSPFNSWAEQGHRILGYKLDSASARPVFSPDNSTVPMAATYTVTIGKDGTYTPAINFVPSKYSPKIEVFLSEKYDISDGYPAYVCSLDSADRLGVFDAYSTADVQPNIRNTEDCADAQTGDVEMRSAKFIDKTLKAGTYYLTVVMNGANSDMTALENYWYGSGESKTEYESLAMLYLKSFTFTPASEKIEPKEYNYDISTDAFTETAKITYSGGVGYNALSQVSWLDKATNVALLDSERTAGYELYNRVSGTYQSNANLDEDGFTSAFLIGTSTDSVYVFDRTFNIGIRLNVPSSGTYKLQLENNVPATSSGVSGYTDSAQTVLEKGAVVDVYFGKADSKANNDVNAYTNYSKDVNAVLEDTDSYLGRYDSRISGTSQVYMENGTYLEAGEYFLIFEMNPTCAQLNPKSVGNGKAQMFAISDIKLTPVQSAEDAALEAERAKYDEVKISKENAIAEIKSENLSDTSYVNVIAKNIEGDGEVATASQVQAIRGESVTVTADEIPDYDFLYWRSGLGADAKVITNNPECTVKAAPGTWLTAVYKKADSEKVSVLFYNADGDIIKNELVEKDAEIVFPDEPAAPAGCGAFLGWALNTKDNIVASANADGDSMVFVAQFEDSTEKAYTITVNGSPLADKKAYGEEVTVTAAERDGTDVFVYWKKGDEIVSFEKEYTFNVFEDCALTAVYAAYKPVTEDLRKIIVSGSVAEFIGLDSAVEKGIIFRDTDDTPVALGNATHKIAMATDGNHLAFNNDLTGSGKTNYIGYAILANGNVVYDK
ncbi:MAG: hypothetical protein E7441_11195 [Ruminococcaceae bacterium]|nr:hypothetical protein [Oscillospiraceae bacterium]